MIGKGQNLAWSVVYEGFADGVKKKKERERERERERETDRDRDRQTDGDKQTDLQRDSQEQMCARTLCHFSWPTKLYLLLTNLR